MELQVPLVDDAGDAGRDVVLLTFSTNMSLMTLCCVGVLLRIVSSEIMIL